ncbi:MAG: TolC family protein [Planctomycetota bacterium]|jgi:outer membrane protein
MFSAKGYADAIAVFASLWLLSTGLGSSYGQTLPPPSLPRAGETQPELDAYPGWEDDGEPNPSPIPESLPGIELREDSYPSKAQQATVLIRPWWIDEANQPLGHPVNVLPRDLDELISAALTHSPHVQSVQLEPQILETKIDQALGPFDPTTFVDSIFRDTSDPVGNTLVTGSKKPLEEIGTDNRLGIKRKNFRGGTTDLGQELDFLDNNSDFFQPKQQASTKLRLGYTQPLMKGSGVSYNRSTIVIAELATDASSQTAIEGIQEHVYKISVAYWELASARAFYRQNRRAIAVLMQLRDQLAGRADIDSLQSQLWRADSAISKLDAAQAKVLAQIAIAEAQLRAAIGSPDLRDASPIEILPMTLPTDWKYDISLQQELSKVLVYHPQIQALKLNIQATRVKLNVAEQDLRPTLDLVVDGYLRGLNGDYFMGQSWVDQFSRGKPSYSGGLVYQRPVRNIASKAILRERRLELRQNLLELDQTLLNIEASVVEAVSQIDAAYQELASSIQATLAVHSELQYLTDRWKDAFRDETQRSLMLDQLLNAQLQLVQSENAWARAQSDHMIAIARLKLVTATLLSTSNP